MQIEIDFELFQALTALRQSESDTLSEVIWRFLRPKGKPAASVPQGSIFWESEGVRFLEGTELRHRFRGNRLVEASIVANGVDFGGSVFNGLSPAAAAAAGHQANGWQFWEVRRPDGAWVKADTLRG